MTPLAWILAAAAVAQEGPRWELAQSLAPPFSVSDHRLADLQPAGEGGASELIVLGAKGEVCVFAHGTGGHAGVLAPEPASQARLADPARALVDLVRLGEGEGLHLVVLGPRDARVFPREGAGFAKESSVLARSASHPFRVGAPRFVDIAQDVNGDGRADLVAPSAESLKLWLATASAGTPPSPWPSFVLAATLGVEVTSSLDHSGADLSDVHSAAFTIPALVARDVNGDGRADLLVSHGSVRGFHLQAADSTYPREPDVQVDLTIFRDTVEKATVRPGHTLAVGDAATYESRDIDGDEIPDYVIAHRRKVWVFHGGSAGPQFTTPSSILKTSDDITALQLVRLDADQRPDLLLVKVQVPTIAALVRGIFGEWDVEVSAAGYLAKEGRTFETKPSRKAELSVRLPAILRLMKNPASFLERFEEVGARFRRSVWEDFDGDGTRDVVLAAEDGLGLELWLSESGHSDQAGGLDGEALLNQVLFEDPQRVWDIERIATWLGGLAEERTARLTRGRASDARFPLRPQAEARLDSMEAADLDGDRRAELILSYTLIPGGTRVYDVLRLAR